MLWLVEVINSKYTVKSFSEKSVCAVVTHTKEYNFNEYRLYDDVNKRYFVVKIDYLFLNYDKIIGVEKLDSIQLLVCPISDADRYLFNNIEVVGYKRIDFFERDVSWERIGASYTSIVWINLLYVDFFNKYFPQPVFFYYDYKIFSIANLISNTLKGLSPHARIFTKDGVNDTIILEIIDESDIVNSFKIKGLNGFNLRAYLVMEKLRGG